MIEARTKAFWTNTIALSIGSLFVFANVYFTQPILPVLTKEFAVSPLQASMSLSLVIFAIGISLFFYGPISDSIGRRGIMIVTMGLGTIVTFLAAFSFNFEFFLVMRVLQGILLAGLPSLALAYIGEEYSTHALSVAIGVFISGNTIGGMFGRIVSGIVTDLYDWQTAFLVMGVVSLVCFVLFVVLLRPSRYFEPKKFDWKEALGVYKSHVLNRELRLAYIVGGLHFFLFVGHFNYVTYLLTSPPYQLPTSLIGVLFLTYIAGTISSQIAGRVSKKFSHAACIKIGILIMVCGLAITLIPSVFAIIGGLLMNCFGFFFAHSTSSSWVSGRATFSKASASGLYLISYYIGGSLGPIYLDPFWNQMNWPGVVIGCYLVLASTMYVAFQMASIEKEIDKQESSKRLQTSESRT
ncbi:MFS transporter [Pontibacillus yanchengensis]|uniref:MFS transporter n=2 Tax=Pontibacillus yanchengensis TaxID=462910 RepID=A0ACC7VHD1_9BACI|nr:MFS transporter [Pontibacillus yanchengensis]MYL35258.1 MFS transporter [Pontibacillus yanchengensis]MYL54868.1 MFS transporter [Pontibacillus yanchengensis]